MQGLIYPSRPKFIVPNALKIPRKRFVPCAPAIVNCDMLREDWLDQYVKYWLSTQAIGPFNSGSSTFAFPTNSIGIDLECWGAGASGGGGGSNSPANNASGGGSGAYSRWLQTSISGAERATPISYSVGAGAAGVGTALDGNDGSASTVTGAAGGTINLNCGGGFGGLAHAPNSGGVGAGAPSNGTTNTGGNNGGASTNPGSSGFGAGAPNGGGNVAGQSTNGSTTPPVGSSPGGGSPGAPGTTTSGARNSNSGANGRVSGTWTIWDGAPVLMNIAQAAINRAAFH